MSFFENVINDYQNVLLNTARIFSSVFEILLGFILVNSFFRPRKKFRRFDYIPFVVLAGVIIFLTETGHAQGMMKYVTEGISLILLLFIFYDGSPRFKALASVLFAMMMTLSVSAGTLIFELISRRMPLGENAFGELIRLAVTNLFLILFALIVSILSSGQKKSTGSSPVRIALFICPAITMVTFAIFQYYIEISSPDNRIVVYIYISGAGLLFMNVLVFLLFARLKSQLEIKRENDILTSQLKLQEASITNLENSYNRTRAFRHDIKNHITLMNMLAEQGKFDELKDYLKEMSGVIDESSYVRISGISAVDAILNEKLYKAQSRSITTSYDVINLDKNSIAPMDLCIILSNALDNAIEANEKIEDKDSRYIKLKIHGNETFSVISVANPTIEQPVSFGSGLKTSKNDKENHGLGLKSIESSVNKYKGEMLCKCTDGVFTIVIRLQAPSDKNSQR